MKVCADVCVCLAGVTLLLAAHSDDSDMLWLISSDNFPFRSLVSESHVCNAILFEMLCGIKYCSTSCITECKKYSMSANVKLKLSI